MFCWSDSFLFLFYDIICKLPTLFLQKPALHLHLSKEVVAFQKHLNQREGFRSFLYNYKYLYSICCTALLQNSFNLLYF